MAELAHQAEEAVEVDVVERGLDLVHQVEGRGPAAEDGEEEGQRGHGALAAREQRDPAHVAAGRAHLDLDPRVEQVLGLGQHHAARAAREEQRDQRRRSAR